jgi:4-amino-4-deoxy-L-arabinose transferase-like glycosyltransferase
MKVALRRSVRSALNEYWPLALLLPLGAALRLLWWAYYMSGPGLDGAGYVDLAIGLSEGIGYDGLNARTGGFVAPLYPLLTTLMTALPVGSISTVTGAARAMSLVSGAMLVAPIWCITRRLYGKRVATIAGLLIATDPLLVHLSSVALPDMLCIMLVCTATYWVIRGSDSASATAAALAGMFHGLAILTRPEAGLVLAANAAAIMLANGSRWRSGLRVALLIIAWSVPALAAGALFVTAHNGRIPFGAVPQVASEYLLGGMLTALRALSLPLVLTVSIVGLLRSVWKVDGIAHALLASTLVSMFIAFGMSATPLGMAAGVLAIITVWGAKGAIEIASVLAGQVEAPWKRVVQFSAIVSTIAAGAFLSYRGLAEPNATTRLTWDLGWWLASAEPARKHVMDTSVNAALHAGATYVPFPVTDSKSALEHIEKIGVDYLVLRKAHVDRRSYLRDWFEHGIPERRARLVSNHFSGIPDTRKGLGEIVIFKWLRDQDDTATSSVSARSGARLTTHQRTAHVVPADGPLKVSSANPRYFENSAGEIVYLTGFHTWPSLQDAGRMEPFEPFDFDSYLANLREHRVNFVRLWAWEQANWVPWSAYDFRVAPLPYSRVGPELALDGKPKFDVTRFDPHYFRRLRERVKAAGENGIYVSVMLFQGWSVAVKGARGKNPWNGHPFNVNNNINGIDGDLGRSGEGLSLHSLKDPRIVALQEKYVTYVIDSVNDLDNVLFEICNECDGSSVEWQYHMIRFIQSVEDARPKQHPVGMTVPYPRGSNADLERSPADWISPNTEGGYLSDPSAADGHKVIISDTDHLWGLGGSRSWVWKSFVRGLNPIFMDADDNEWMYPPGGDSLGPQWEDVRRNMGYAAQFAEQMDLRSAVPRGDLCSPSYCLARADGAAPEYLVYAPEGGRARLDLRGMVPGMLEVEWFHPATGGTRTGTSIQTGSIVEFTSPFRGDAVLHVFTRQPAETE